MSNRLIITIDGPAGTGKSTVSKMLATRLTALYLDTGALYRAVALKALDRGIPPGDEEAIAALCDTTEISCMTDHDGIRILVNGDDVSDRIRTEEVSLAASKVSALPAVRRFLLPIQRHIADMCSIIAEGRDMGTVVFPHADVKFYLDADETERARRRHHQLCGEGVKADFDEVKKGLTVRDRQDSGRAIAPLKPSDDAVIIDSTTLKAEEVVEVMIARIQRHLLENQNNSKV